MLRVFIALGKQLPKDKAMLEDTQEVARLLAKYNCTMVQGGAKIGLMGLAVNEFQKYSDEVVMIVPEVHKDDLVGAKCKEHYIVEGESDRMRITIHTCDMMVVLPGGSGTMAEISYYNETRKSGEHNAKVVVVNTNGYYNKLFKFHKHQIKHGLMDESGIQYQVIKSAKELEPILQQLITEKQEKLQQEELKLGKEELIADIVEETAKARPVKKVTVKKVAPKTIKSKKATAKKQEAKPAAKKSVKKSTTKSSKVEKAPAVKQEVEKVEQPKVEKAKTTSKPKATKASIKAKSSTKTAKAKAEKEVKAEVNKTAKAPAKTTKSQPKAKVGVKKVAKAKTTSNKKASASKKVAKNK